ncbi:small ubiquitin-related modifier 2 [Heterocephalus glaber]|uniref:Small ubiquitin-related modifier 2 n=1 Tax=Heterocephalus glaber TaxID=10181 RepID=A0AAX6T5K8_HETGA|nr:small ubiquitin-related modifier 2 [Heterocephalus glaber]
MYPSQRVKRTPTKVQEAAASQLFQGQEEVGVACPLPRPPLLPPSATPGAACVLVRYGPGTSFVKRQLRRLEHSLWPKEKPKEGVKTENNDHINLKVAGQDGSVVQFKIKRHTPLSKLMKAYCERQGLSVRQIRFRFDGLPINETDTPAQLELEDKDTVDVFQQQTGGVY